MQRAKRVLFFCGMSTPRAPDSEGWNGNGWKRPWGPMTLHAPKRHNNLPIHKMARG